MSEEHLNAFLEKIKVDTSLQVKLQAAGDVDTVLEIAKEAGFKISADDLKKAQSELSDEELEGTAGGNGPVTNPTNGCGCPPGAITHFTMDTNPRCGC